MNTTTLLGSVTAYAEVLNTLDAYTEARGNAQACRALTRVTTDQAERVKLTGRADWRAMRADAL